MNYLINISKSEIDGSEVNSVNARELHSHLESKQDFSTWIKARIEKFGFVENEDFIKLHKKMELSLTGQICVEYIVTIDMAKELAMVENNQKGRDARKYFIQIEKQNKPRHLSRRELAQLVIDQEDRIEELQKTKSYISDKKTATALNTASQATKKVHKLQTELDKSKEYCTIKRMGMIYHGQKFSWRILKSTANEMGISSIDVFDQNYGTVKAYHRDVWIEAYGLEF